MDIQINENSPRQARTDKSFLICLLKKHITLFLFILFSCLSAFGQKTYQKTYFDNGNLKSEGWVENNQKTKYWKFYYKNGTLKKEGRFNKGKETKYWYFYRADGTKEKEGHFNNGVKNKWWLFYDDMEMIIHKCQLKNNQKNGYCLMYENKKIISARKYKAGKQIKEWTDFKSFRKENNLRDLQ
ncbi:toxin-antitoxin system YwqK family antitoxin [Ichthyenterobacterium magnum]|uniref:MORN repeat protein n=1 Tax=Ichthyenterobacterium magnum TaxID=1230530 RepID=A0A420DW06_9FLAO|nr:hypothetical protein [Ichthyenterobacterium magnum]RKE98418.1 hypothetical protein BXY80_0505 [Ichthyenterobacterium magnum]